MCVDTNTIHKIIRTLRRLGRKRCGWLGARYFVFTTALITNEKKKTYNQQQKAAGG
jgi:hypothetical protein